MGFRMLARDGRRALLSALTGAMLALSVGLAALLALAPPGA